MQDCRLDIFIKEVQMLPAFTSIWTEWRLMGVTVDSFHIGCRLHSAQMALPGSL
jgi:hypothetical protein